MRSCHRGSPSDSHWLQSISTSLASVGGSASNALSCFFFFSSRRRHTRWNCDWSSDVCSSDLLARGAHVTRFDLSEPSLETIFIELVGRPADDDTDSTLASVDDEADDPDAPALIEGAA